MTHDDGTGLPVDSWKPDGWDDWPQKRRTLWRREGQLERMAGLELDTEEQRASRDMWLDHLRGEIEDLRREIASGESAGPAA